MAELTTRWERLEAWLFDNDTREFTVYELAGDLKIPTCEASALINAYLAAQRSVNPTTLYVLKRQGRTRNAVWSVGQRTADARIIGGTLFEDVAVKVRRAFEPDLQRIAERNPRAAKYADAKIAAVMDGALKVLAAAVDSSFSDEDGD
ncbi:MAG: hypothetical protein H0U46_11845 [Actinobacteria bacterium]|nr:hypothetical protein [Actinomycetota bacterium]